MTSLIVFTFYILTIESLAAQSINYNNSFCSTLCCFISYIFGCRPIDVFYATIL